MLVDLAPRIDALALELCLLVVVVLHVSVPASLFPADCPMLPVAHLMHVILQASLSC